MSGRPVDERTVFQTASLSKPTFAFSVLKLWERGILDLDRPLRTYLAEAYEPGDERIDRITARMVLCHTSGLPNWRQSGAELTTLVDPGTRFGYSGEGYVYLQRVVERLTGEPFHEYVRRTLLLPLGMSSSHFVWVDEYDDCAATGYAADGEPRETGRPTTANVASSLHTTLRDFAQIVIATLTPADENQRLLRPSTIAKIVGGEYPALPLLGAMALPVETIASR